MLCKVKVFRIFVSVFFISEMSCEPVVGSFLEPRPPLVNAWNRHILKPAIAMEVRKNLVYHMGESDEDDTEDTIKVFLRLKPCEDNSVSMEC